MQPFFGSKWDAPATDDAPQAPTPVGQQCYLCEREIVEGDQGWIRAMGKEIDGKLVGVPAPVHRGCEMGTTIGHTFGFCSCTGWDDYYERGKALIEHLDALKEASNV